jgi:hypothetical protein
MYDVNEIWILTNSDRCVKSTYILKREIEWESGGEKGYTKIGAGKRVKFAVIAESGCSYLTINTNTGKEVCNNHELTKSTNVIVEPNIIDACVRDIDFYTCCKPKKNVI